MIIIVLCHFTNQNNSFSYFQSVLSHEKRKHKKKLKAQLAEASTSHSQLAEDTSDNSKQKIRTKRKRMHNYTSESDQPIEKPSNKRKLLNIITSAGEFTVEPITPPKMQFGFKESPLTPRNEFKVKNLFPKVPQPNVDGSKFKKRKVSDISEPVTILPKPKWMSQNDEKTIGTMPTVKRQKQSHGLEIFDNVDSTNFVLQSNEMNKKKKLHSKFLIPVEMLEYRKKVLYRNGIPRHDSCNLKRLQDKAKANRYG